MTGRTRHHTARYRLTGLVAAVTALAVAAGCGTAGDPTAEAAGAGGTLTVGLAKETECRDPQQDNYGYGGTIGRQIVDSLTERNGVDLARIEPWLATSWEISPDASTYTFKLRDDVTFSDGSVFDASVVKANFEALAGIRAATGAAFVQGIRAISTPEKFTVRIEFDKPNAAFLQATSSWQLGILAPASVAKTPEQRCSEGVIGSGPYLVKEAVYNEQTTLARRADYAWPSKARKRTGAAAFDKVVFRIVPEAGVRTGAISSGQLDLAQSISWQDGPVLEKAGQQLLKAVNRVPAVSLEVNTSRPILNEEAVRVALTHAIDRRKLVETAHNGFTFPATGSLTAANPFHLPQPEALKYDPERSRTLLDQAGWQVGADGIRTRNGKRLTITASFVGNPDNQTFLEVIQQQVREVGIDFALRPLSTGEFDTALVAGDYDVHRWSGALVDGDVLRILFSTKTLNKSRLAPGNDLDALLQRQVAIGDPAERRTVLDEIQRVLVERAYQIPVFDMVNLWGAGRKLTGVEFDDSSLILYDAQFTS
ncbi:ABC transporter substrate-binding protein [Micromonospora echinofusca]|uniref:ABC transporter substrate-binding protein n=1 Tax=Micromonospora echinofusca TaxID=47858 RepID=A0ABS3VQE9_MICEH|nr:ABC transporter substrate-binding protein [Micromonospora echinofusca]MBO4206776.1 ABC transporter substrate-binding protein [Micromonospora echinofusca]